MHVHELARDIHYRHKELLVSYPNLSEFFRLLSTTQSVIVEGPTSPNIEELIEQFRTLEEKYQTGLCSILDKLFTEYSTNTTMLSQVDEAIVGDLKVMRLTRTPIRPKRVA